jgi:hypothetical protein
VSDAPGSNSQKGCWNLGQPLVRHAHDLCQMYAGKVSEHRFELGWGHVLAADPEHLLQPGKERQVARLVGRAQVAGPEPATGKKRRRRLIWGPEITLADTGTPNLDLTNHACGLRRSVLCVNNPHVDAWKRNPRQW